MEEQLIFSWGANSYGQLGVGHRDDRHSPQQLERVKFRVKAVTGGGGHTVVISDEGRVFVCGWNQKGQLGLGHRDDVSILTQVTALAEPVATVACGWDFTLAVTESGRLFSWGSNAFGQLGIPEVTGRGTPTPVQALEGVRIVGAAAGLRHAVVLDDTGELWTWGAGKRGQLGRLVEDRCPTVSKQPSRVQLGAGPPFVAIVAGSYHSAALDASGELYVWGRNDKGQLTNSCNGEKYSGKPSNHVEHYNTSSSASANHIQQQDASQSSPYEKQTGVTSPSVLDNQLQADATKKTVVDPGKQESHKSSSPSCVDIVDLPLRLDPALFSWKKVVQIESGWTHLVAITEDRRAWTWGRADYGQLGKFGDKTALPHSYPQPAELSALYGVKQLKCGSEHNIAVIGNQVVCWGWNEHGMCGDGGEEDVLTPKAVKDLQSYTPVWVSTGAGHTMVGVKRNKP